MRLGVDIGGTNTGIGVVDEDGNVIAQQIFPTNKDKAFEVICEDILNNIRQLASQNNLDIHEIDSIGIGLPGIINSREGIFVFAPNLQVSNFPIKKFFEDKLGVSTFIENDANCAALAEAVFGAASEYSTSVTITIGTGIGGGIIIDKKIFRGSNNSAGEIGHMVININGEKCGCGRQGCWEQYASATALRRMAVNAVKLNDSSVINKLCGWDLNRINGKIIFDALSQGDKTAKKVTDEYIQYLGAGIVNLINILDPDAVVVGGGISKQGDRILNPIKAHIKKSIVSKADRLPAVVCAKFGREAGIIGASLLSEYN